MTKKKRIFITVMTYPRPSDRHREVVCTAGVTESGDFIRLHPVNRRALPRGEKYRKYQWIDLAVEKNAADPRPESYRLCEGSRVEVASDVVTDWSERMRVVLARGKSTMCGLQRRKGRGRPSLGIIRPKRIKDVRIVEAEGEWSERQRAIMERAGMCGAAGRPLEKLPYNFKFRYECEYPGCRGNHTMTNLDWEVSELYRKIRRRRSSSREAAEAVREKLLNRVCGPTREVYFYVGNQYRRWNAWLILGILWPPKGTLKRLQSRP